MSGDAVRGFAPAIELTDGTSWTAGNGNEGPSLLLWGAACSSRGILDGSLDRSPPSSSEHEAPC